jgi:hypothetical protein
MGNEHTGLAVLGEEAGRVAELEEGRQAKGN